MAANVTTSLRVSEDVRERYDALAKLTGRTRTGLMIEAIEQYIEHQLQEIALVQEGLAQLDAGLGIPHDDVVAQLVARGMLSSEQLERDRAHRQGR